MKTAKEFREFFEAIPNEKWRRFYPFDHDGQMCAKGHLDYYRKIGREKVLTCDKILVQAVSRDTEDVNDWGFGGVNLDPKQNIISALIVAEAKGL